MTDRDLTTSRVYLECLELFVQNGGRNISAIERDMHARGHAFHRRSLYSRGNRPGWIERFGWKQHLPGNAGTLACMSPKGEVERGIPNPEYGIETKGGNPTCREGVRKCGIENAEFGIETSNSQPPTATSQPPTDFRAWLRTVSPNMNWHWRHVQHICDQLERFTRGETKRLMLFMPPRHGKSELVTVRYTAWRMKRDPEMNVIVAGCGQRLANRFSRKIRNVLAESAAKDGSGVSSPSVSSPHVSKGSTQQDAQDMQDENAHSAKRRQDVEMHGAAENPHSSFRTQHSTCPCCSPNHARRINSVAEWETHAGGGFRAVGVGGAVTGFGANLIVIDDPIKSRQQAESQTYRDRTWEWYNDDISTRLEPDGQIILIQTRWHEDDLAGRLLRDMEHGGDQWEVISLPAIAEPKGEKMKNEAESETAGNARSAGNARTAGNAGTLACMSPQGDSVCENPHVSKGSSQQDAHEKKDSVASHHPDTETQTPSALHPSSLILHPSHDWRLPGQALCPDRFDEEELEKLRRQLGTYSYSALYQQTPTPREGGHFKRKWFSRIVEAPPPCLEWARGYDLAVSTAETADYTASFRCAFDKDGTLYIDGGFRDRIEYPDQRRYLLERLAAEPDTVHGIETALHGQAFIQDIRRNKESRGRRLVGVKVGKDKMTRVLTWSPLAENGKLALVRGGWIQDFIDEAGSFPHGTHDDQIDAVSIAVEVLAKHTGKLGSYGF